MGLQKIPLLPLLLALGCFPAGSFLVYNVCGRTASSTSSTIFIPRGADDDLSAGLEARLSRGLPTCRARRREDRADEGTGSTPRRSSPEEAPSFISHDSVSYLQNQEMASDIWLVGVVHGATASVQLMENVMREIKPQVAMLELDADRLDCLPPGEVQMAEDGLRWFTAEQTPDDDTASPEAVNHAKMAGTAEDTAELAPTRRKRRRFGFVTIPAARLFIKVMEVIVSALHEEDDLGEMEAAVREAQACGARVLLGDRDFEETKHQLVSAGLADSMDDERLDDPEDLLKDSMSVSDKKKFASLGLRKPETRETAREYYAALGTVGNAMALKAMIPERDEVMARNLMSLDGGQTTVAIVGIFHVDGIERILTNNGWERQSELARRHT
ncbi:unnamed protein product [Scytosiphon promiscuus]